MTPLILTPEAGGERLDAFVASQVEDLTRSAAQRLLEEGAVTQGGRALKKNHRTCAGEVLEAGVRAAWAGAEHTKDLVATKGRASYVGERGLGHQDPGATSYSYMLEVIAGLV